MSRAASSSALAVLAAIVLAGCGGGDDGDPRAFAASADRACGTLSRAVHELRDGLVRTDAKTEGAGLGTALSHYATTVRRTADDLAKARPPKNEKAFRDAAVKGLRRHAGAMRSAADQARTGRAPTALDDEVRGGEMPKVPATLLTDAPACRRTAD